MPYANPKFLHKKNNKVARTKLFTSSVVGHLAMNVDFTRRGGQLSGEFLCLLLPPLFFIEVLNPFKPLTGDLLSPVVSAHLSLCLLPVSNHSEDLHMLYFLFLMGILRKQHLLSELKKNFSSLISLLLSIRFYPRKSLKITA